MRKIKKIRQTYLIRILYCGDESGVNFMFKSNKGTEIHKILVDFHKHQYDEKISIEEARSLYLKGEDTIELLVNMDDKVILLEQ